MKKRINIFIIVLILIIPLYISASSTLDYNSGLARAEEYIKKGNFRVTHDKYIKETSLSHFIEEYEYLLTRDSNSKSYLFDGVEYWTSTGNSSKHTIINYKGKTEKKLNSEKYNAKDVEYVKDDVKVRGKGTYNNPWTFDTMYEVIVKTDEAYGYVKDGEDKKSINNQFVTKGGNVVLEVGAKAGYKYIDNDCGGTQSNGHLTINNVTRNMTCNIVFGTGKYTITLNGATPNKIYVNYRDNFYSTNEYKNVITKITPPAAPTGYTFGGYKWNNSVYVVKANGTINRAAANKITSNKTLTAVMNANEIVFPNKTIAFSFSASEQSKNVTAATNGTGNYKYEKISGDSEITVSNTGKITIPANKAVGTYPIEIKATDTGSNKNKTATYTINIE